MSISKTINNFLNKHNWSKRKAIILFTKYRVWEGRGNYWISFLETFFNWKEIILYGGIVSLKYPNIPFWFIIIGVIAIGMITRVLKIWIGWIDYKKDVARIQNETLNKDERIQSFNVELRDSLIEICNKLEIPHHFVDLKTGKKNYKL